MNSNKKNMDEITSLARKKLDEWLFIQNYNFFKSMGSWMEFNKNLILYIFFVADVDLKLAEQNNFLEITKNQHRIILEGLGVNENDIVRIEYHFDSDENVQKNYQGSYFYRLR